jgi:hypothetical protein
MSLLLTWRVIVLDLDIDILLDWIGSCGSICQQQVPTVGTGTVDGGFMQASSFNKKLQNWARAGMSRVLVMTDRQRSQSSVFNNFKYDS